MSGRTPLGFPFFFDDPDAAGPGDDEQGAVDVEDGGALRLVQAGEEVFVGAFDE